MKPYEEAFQKGVTVRIVDGERLRRFRQTWAYHNKLSREQMKFAGVTAIVDGVGFYHGGDPLYTLRGVPGIWHEECLEAAG